MIHEGLIKHEAEVRWICPCGKIDGHYHVHDSRNFPHIYDQADGFYDNPCWVDEESGVCLEPNENSGRGRNVSMPETDAAVYMANGVGYRLAKGFSMLHSSDYWPRD